MQECDPLTGSPGRGRPLSTSGVRKREDVDRKV